MPWKAIAISCLLLQWSGWTLCADTGSDPQAIEITADPAVRRVMWRLLADSRWGFSHTEKAAFIVRTSSGELACLLWRSDDENQARWRGAFPRGTIAIAHTHPNWLPAPSGIDMRTARRTNTLVYVVTRSRIYRTAGGKPEMVFKGDWKP